VSERPAKLLVYAALSAHNTAVQITSPHLLVTRYSSSSATIAALLCCKCSMIGTKSPPNKLPTQHQHQSSPRPFNCCSSWQRLIWAAAAAAAGLLFLLLVAQLLLQAPVANQFVNARHMLLRGYCTWWLVVMLLLLLLLLQVLLTATL